MHKNITLPLVVVCLVVGLLAMPAACANSVEALTDQPFQSQTTSAKTLAVPYLPPAYYNCIEVLPVNLEAAYYSEYGAVAGAETMYNGKYFVFKDQLVDAYMLRELDNGWLWADLTKCPIIDADYAENLKAGDRVDIVGICMGRDLKESPGLYFSDCYVLLTGSVQLPAPGGETTFAAGY